LSEGENLRVKSKYKKARRKYKKINWGGLQTSQAGVLNEGLFDGRQI